MAVILLNLVKRKKYQHDEGDVHSLMIGAAGVGKTAKFLYPNIEYCCATGMSFVTSDTKGDLLRSYAPIAKKYYGYDISVLDLRNPTQSDGFNMLHMVNKYMDEYLQTDSLVAKAKAEKYTKIISKTIMNSGGFDSANAGQNAFFYDSAEGLITSVILVIAEFCSPYNDTENIEDKGEERHIISVFKLIQDLLAPSEVKGKSQFKLLMEKLPEEHKARWLSGAALNTSDQAMASVLSTALSRLNAFLDSEIEQLLCFETKIYTEKFCKINLPYVVCRNQEQYDLLSSDENINPFEQYAILISTYDFVIAKENIVSKIQWDLIVFEEANTISNVYQDNNKQVKVIDNIAGSSFRLLLTGTPIEKNIMDLYGLIWFIDKSALPQPQEFCQGICVSLKTIRN